MSAPARTTAAAVKSILRLGSDGGDYDDANNPSLDPYIESASAMMDRVIICAAAKGQALSVVEEELIERWLSAHAYCVSDQTYASRSTAGRSASFHGQTAMYLESTRYGQFAVSLDPSGCLNALGKRQSAGATWLGRPPSEQTDYIYRD